MEEEDRTLTAVNNISCTVLNKISGIDYAKFLKSNARQNMLSALSLDSFGH